MKVNVLLGVTLKVNEGDYVKPQIELVEIDPEGDVDAQIEEGISIARKSFLAIDGELDNTISKILAPVTNAPTVSSRVSELETDYQYLRERINSIVEGLNRLKPLLEQEVKSVGSSKSRRTKKDSEGSQ